MVKVVEQQALNSKWLAQLANGKDDQVVKLSLDDLRPNPYQPRKVFDQGALEELANSIKKTGVFQPVIVRPSKVKGYELIAGERRFRASIMAGQKQIPAIIRTISDEEMMEIAVVENLQREDLNPLEEAQAYATLMEKLHLNQTQLAKRLGKSRPYIANYLRLLGLPPKVKHSLRAGELSMAQARTLLSLNDKSKLAQLAQKTVSEGLTVRQLTELVAKLNGAKKVKPKPAKATNQYALYYQETAQLLAEKLGTKVEVKPQGKKAQGKIEIDYYSIEDFNRILEILQISLD